MNIFLLQALIIIGGGAIIAFIGLVAVGYIFEGIKILLGK